MASGPANGPSPWLSDEQRARMEQSIGYILHSEISKEGDPRDLSVDDPKRQIEVFDKLSLVLNACRNRRVPINHLPQDVMHHIFSIVLQLEDMHNLELPNPYPTYLVTFIDQRKRLRLVSRTWNSFVVSTPSFWSLVDMLAPDLEVLHARIERAGQRELCVTHRSGLFTEKYCEHLALFLTPHLHRVRTLRLGNEGVAAALLKNPFPTLRALELRLNGHWQTESLPTITQDYFPQLHTLQLSGCFIPRNTTPLNTLRILRLHHILQEEVVEILALLAQCSYLEELAILSQNQSPWMGLQSTALRLDNLRRLEVRDLDVLSLPCLFRYAKIPNFKEVIIAFPLAPVPNIGAALLQCLDELQVLNSSTDSVEISMSDDIVTCVMEDGRSVEVTPAAPQSAFSEECANRFLEHLQPSALRITVELQHQGIIRWIHQSFDRRNVVELRARRGILRESRALVDGLAIFGDGEEDTEESFDLELPLPLPSLQTLIFEDSDIDVPHLLRMVSNRATHPQATAATRIKQITLSSCSTRNAPDLSSRFRDLGVNLTLR
ncbi:hypothetical protein FRC04_005378 [Tulasnella sp. 424]|nr:hypothetical protein FRC04_005378 [Tulasnella sp. 424]KAG8976485.1 hypothetical protein FRC05_003728 [Tulasnella sp. 425]